MFFSTLGTGEVSVNADPSFEYPQTMSMEICANDRRNEVCGNLTIVFSKLKKLKFKLGVYRHTFMGILQMVTASMITSLL